MPWSNRISARIAVYEWPRMRQRLGHFTGHVARDHAPQQRCLRSSASQPSSSHVNRGNHIRIFEPCRCFFNCWWFAIMKRASGTTLSSSHRERYVQGRFGFHLSPHHLHQRPIRSSSPVCQVEGFFARSSYGSFGFRCPHVGASACDMRFPTA